MIGTDFAFTSDAARQNDEEEKKEVNGCQPPKVPGAQDRSNKNKRIKIKLMRSRLASIWRSSLRWASSWREMALSSAPVTSVEQPLTENEFFAEGERIGHGEGRRKEQNSTGAELSFGKGIFQHVGICRRK